MKPINTFVFPIIRKDYILDALKSLSLVTAPNYQTVVVDQTQPDAEFEEQVRALCDVHVKTRKNYGFAQGTNIGWRLAMDWDHGYTLDVYEACNVWKRDGFELQPTQCLTACNDDVVFVTPTWWPGIVETFERYDTAVCVSPMSPKEPGWGYGQEGYIEHLTLRESIERQNIMKLIEDKNGQMIDGLVCWCSVFKASLFDEIGMFDERFWPGAGEDYCLMGRIYRAGYRALASSLSWVYHYWGQSKDEPTGFDTALPPARAQWNRLDLLWPGGFDVWAKDSETGEWLERVPEVAIMPL